MPHPICHESVVLLNPAGDPIGTASKESVHTADTPFHSAFSIFLFNRKGDMLAQQRASSKKTWPCVWSNACCGHPLPGEDIESAAHRRLKDELGLSNLKLHLLLPEFRYRAEHMGIVENELCPVFAGRCDAEPEPNPFEVMNVQWIPWASFADSCKETDGGSFAHFSPWSLIEGKLLSVFPLVRQFTLHGEKAS